MPTTQIDLLVRTARDDLGVPREGPFEGDVEGSDLFPPAVPVNLIAKGGRLRESRTR